MKTLFKVADCRLLIVSTHGRETEIEIYYRERERKLSGDFMRTLVPS